MSNLTESRNQRKTSSSSRFEVEKVEENKLADNLKMIDSDSVDDRAVFLNKDELDSSQKSGILHSDKQPVKRYIDDEFFDFGTEKTTQHKSVYFDSKLNDDEKEPLNEESSNKDDDTNSNTGCFAINYDERNQPVSITLNLNKTSVNSYNNCFRDFRTSAFYQKLLAEFIGTMILTLYACSIGLPIAEKFVPSINGCLGGGLTLASLIWGLGNISGGHLNPAVSIAFLFTGKINPLMTLFYVAAQLIGASTGSIILQNLAPAQAQGNLSVTSIHPDITIGQAFGIELIITFILVITIFSCVDSARSDLHGSFPLQIGFAVVIGGLFGGRFTGGSMNPARSFGPALVTGIWKDHWVYWLGPVIGSVLAGVIYQFVLTVKCPRNYLGKSGSKS